MRNKAYLGVDCGSASVKMALIDEEENLIDSCYFRNSGITETIKKGLEKLAGNENDYEIKGVGTTGSGRGLSKVMLGGDLVKTEIFAHVIGTLKYHKDARVISDIGGEDSKLMMLNEGILEDFVLNNSCSAGTSSSLEAIATRMGVKIEDVGDLALKSTKKLNISTKCGIFMTSEAINFLNSGAKKEDILWGVVNGMVSNYLTMAQGKDLQPPHIYTGMPSRNKAIVKAFNEQLGYEIIVPEHSPIMGAIGSAIIVCNNPPEKTKFKGFEIADIDYQTEIRTATGCENNCQITDLYQQGVYLGSIGNRCEKCVK